MSDPHVEPALTAWHRLDRFLARLRPHREPLSLLVDAAVVAACWNVTYLFRLGFERWISARPGYDGWVLLGIVGAAVLVLLPEALRFLNLPDAFAANLRMLIYGLLLVLMMHFRPQGIAGQYRME